MQIPGVESLGIRPEQLWIPFAVLVGAVLLRLLIHALSKRVRRTKTEFDDRMMAKVASASTPILLICVLYAASLVFPLSPAAATWVNRAFGLLALALVMPAISGIVMIVLENAAVRQTALVRYVQPLRTLVNAVLLLIGIALAMRIVNLSVTGPAVTSVKIAGIVIGAYIILKIVNLAVAKLQSFVDDGNLAIESEAEKRAKTLGRIINSVALVIVASVGIMMILSEFGLDITPIITSAGIVGLAVGFGAQNLVRDIISGFFLILEDQVRVGDVAIINGTGGLVEAIKLRTLVLRDLEGVVHIFPNGAVTQVSNMTKQWSRYVIDVGVAYKEDVDHVMKVLAEVGEDLTSDPKFRLLVLGPLEILGVDDFGESQVTIKVMIKTLPLKQWEVGRELRRRIKIRFDKEGIEIPFPHVSVYFGEASKPFAMLLERRAAANERPGQPAAGAL